VLLHQVLIHKGDEKMKRMILSVVIIGLLTTTSSLAGEATLTKGKAKLVLSCSNGCSATITQNGKTTTKDLGNGGRANFSKHLNSYRAQGWK
jgi:hypothetical protein